MTGRRAGLEVVGTDASEIAGVDRRRTRRMDAVVRAKVRLAELDGTQECAARIVDISDLGVRMLVKRRLPVGARVLIDVECELPLRVHLGYDIDALVVDGPAHTHLVRVAGTVARLGRHGTLYDAGVEFCAETTRFDELQVVRFYVDHLREQEAWGT